MLSDMSNSGGGGGARQWRIQGDGDCLFSDIQNLCNAVSDWLTAEPVKCPTRAEIHKYYEECDWSK